MGSLKKGSKWLFGVATLLLAGILISSCQKSDALLSTSEQMYKADYLEACQLIADKYIYLESKLGESRTSFVKRSVAHANSVDWHGGKTTFIRELRLLKAQFPDGHLEWDLAKEQWPMKMNKTLGFTATATQDGKVKVGRVYSPFTSQIEYGDEILLWNGKPVLEELKCLESLNPQSTALATREKAARRLALDFTSQPLRDRYDPVKLKCRHLNGKISEVVLEWKDCNLQRFEEQADAKSIIITRGKIASLNSVPTDAQEVVNDLPYYFWTIGGKKYAILHPLSFYQWTADELDQTMGAIMDGKPEVVVIDLQDTAGGAFDQVLYLAHALNAKARMTFTNDYIDEGSNKRYQKVDNFDSITEAIQLKHIWKGKLLIFTNGITVSAGDYFSRWMQLNDRGTIVGIPTAGAGGGTTDFKLSRTHTNLSIPMRDRKILGDANSIEGHAVVPDELWSGTVLDYLEKRLNDGTTNTKGTMEE